MKNIHNLFYLLILVFTFTQTSFAQTNKTEFNYFTDLEEATSEAEKTGKPLLIFMHRKSCGNCAGTWKAILGDKILQSQLEKKVVFVKINVDGSSSSSAYFMIRDSGGSYRLPLIGIIDVNSEEVFVDSEGYKTPDDLGDMLNTIN